MDLQADDFVETYRKLALHPTLSHARVFNADSPGFVRIYSEWTQRDLERSEKIKFALNHIVHSNTIISTPPTDIGTQLLTAESPSGKYRAVLRQVKTKKGEEKQFIEIWSDACKLHNIDVDTLDQHGKVYEDETFGTWAWSHSETHLLYVAEKKQPKPKSFFDKKAAEEESKDESSTEKSGRGTEHLFKDDWGEVLVGKSLSVLCVLDVEDGAVSTLENLPEDVAAGQGIWCQDDQGVVCVGWYTDPYRLGLYACPIRRTALFHIDLKTSTCSIIGPSDRSVRSPRFNHNHTKLIFLDNRVGGPHMQCSRLVMCDWSTKGFVPVIDVVRKHSATTGDQFPGVFLDKLSKRCWSEDNKRIVMNTQWRSKKELVVVNVETGEVTRLTNDPEVGSWTVLDVHKELIVALCGSPNRPNYLMLGLLPPEGSETTISWTKLDEDSPVLEGIKWSIHPMTVADGAQSPKFPDLDYEAILLEPSEARTPSTLVLFLHGGPHAATPADFSLSLAGMVTSGLAVLAVNYRGSFGFRQDSIDCLPGMCGNLDVKDCQNACEAFVKRNNYEKVVVTGGSHGGFLTAHLIGQYPDYYKAAIVRNPVINIATMLGVTDIPDWCVVCARGLDYEMTESGSVEAYRDMWCRSPISHADQMKTPTMIMIGADDRRVPPKQSHELRKALQARGVPVKTLEYLNNGHGLTNVDTEADCFVHIMLWFMEHLQ